MKTGSEGISWIVGVLCAGALLACDTHSSMKLSSGVPDAGGGGMGGSSATGSTSSSASAGQSGGASVLSTAALGGSDGTETGTTRTAGGATTMGTGGTGAIGGSSSGARTSSSSAGGKGGSAGATTSGSLAGATAATGGTGGTLPPDAGIDASSAARDAATPDTLRPDTTISDTSSSATVVDGGVLISGILVLTIKDYAPASPACVDNTAAWIATLTSFIPEDRKCWNDTDCSYASFSSGCGMVCPVPINKQRIGEFGTQVMSNYTTKCGVCPELSTYPRCPAPPGASEVACKNNQCEWK